MLSVFSIKPYVYTQCVDQIMIRACNSAAGLTEIYPFFWYVNLIDRYIQPRNERIDSSENDNRNCSIKKKDEREGEKTQHSMLTVLSIKPYQVRLHTVYSLLNHYVYAQCVDCSLYQTICVRTVCWLYSLSNHMCTHSVLTVFSIKPYVYAQCVDCSLYQTICVHTVYSLSNHIFQTISVLAGCHMYTQCFKVLILARVDFLQFSSNKHIR